MVAEIQTPALILFGEGSLARIGEALQKIGVSRPLVVTDRGLVSTPVFAALRGALSSAGIEFGVFSDTVPDPDMTAVEAGADAFRAGSYDGFIGFGGGSAMDTAKAINLMLHSEGDIRRWRVPNSPSMRTLPLLCVPTTAGTGSEVTRGVVITDPATHEKIVFMGLACLPQAAVVDPDLTRRTALPHCRRHRPGCPDPRDRSLCQPQAERSHRRHGAQRHAADRPQHHSGLRFPRCQGP